MAVLPDVRTPDVPRARPGGVRPCPSTISRQHRAIWAPDAAPDRNRV